MATRRTAVHRIARRGHTDNADHRVQRNTQGIVPHQLVAIDGAQVRAPGIETVAANAFALARAGSGLPVELDSVDAHLERAACNRALHVNWPRSGIDVVPVDLIKLVGGLLHLVAEAVLRANTHRLARRHRQRRFQSPIKCVENLLIAQLDHIFLLKQKKTPYRCL